MCLQEASFYGLVAKEARQSPVDTKKVVELPFTKGFIMWLIVVELGPLKVLWLITINQDLTN